MRLNLLRKLSLESNEKGVGRIRLPSSIHPQMYTPITEIQYIGYDSKNQNGKKIRIKADKEKSTEKIDGAIATIMALDRAIRCGNQNTDSRGILFR